MREFLSFKVMFFCITWFVLILTTPCSGVFTVAGIVDAFIYHGQKALKKKIEMGKFS